MTSLNFSFLQKEYPILYNLTCSAEYNLHVDPVVSLIKLRQFGERITTQLFLIHGLDFPSDNSNTFHYRIKKLQDEGVLQANMFSLFQNIRYRGNLATHESLGSFEDAKVILESGFKIAKWFYEGYSEENKDIQKLTFNTPPNQDTRKAVELLEKELQQLKHKVTEFETKASEGISADKALEFKTRSERSAKNIELDEAETRELIDAQLRQAGWEADTNKLNYRTNKTVPEKGRKIAIAEWPVGKERADYALFVDKKLFGIVEAKKWSQDISTNLRQSKIYASQVTDIGDAIILGQWQDYKVPFLFSTNGRPYLKQIETKSGIWFLDARKNSNRSHSLQGWYSPDGLQSLYTEDIEGANNKLRDSQKDFLRDRSGLQLRPYQIEAIEKIEQFILNNKDEKKALLAMATGTGKTRTIIGLCYRLIKANRFKRILFLTDRRSLAIQAINDFKDKKVESLNTFQEIYKVEELKTVIPDIETRLHFATVQSMVKRLFYKDDASKKNEIPSIDTYDCIIIDEAHRGYLEDREMDEEELEFKNQQDYVSKYRMVLDYFDAYAIGLTATPALHTIEIFGKPVYNYSYREAVVDGFLKDHDLPKNLRTQLSQNGIVWKKGERPKVYDRENNQIIELDELDDELRIDIEGFNKLVLTEPFNRTVIQQLVHDLNPDGEEKTLVFAANDEHADLIVKIFKEEFEKIGVDIGDDAIMKITGKAYKPEHLINLYKNEKYPNIAVTVDLLTTGIDVPRICNLVFMRRVKSRILFEQMLGRATRLCDDIGKEFFRIFDAVRLYEALEDFTSMKPVLPTPSTTFIQLVGEIKQISSEERIKRQIEQIIAKIQRKKKKIKGEDMERFKHSSGGRDPEDYINMLKELPQRESIPEIMKAAELWKFLDEFHPPYENPLVSEHIDKALDPEYGYGNGKRPEDYLEGFRKYVTENINRITGLNIVCNKPTLLDRKSLKELYIALDQEGYKDLYLRHAWKQVKNEDVAADIISFIRTLTLGDALVDHETRIKNAVNRIRKSKTWNKIQQTWLDRFEAQLIHESVLSKDDVNETFRDAGGYDKLNRIFEQQLDSVLNTINENLYKQVG
jgi:type I restriction enzyme R subunit